MFFPIDPRRAKQPNYCGVIYDDRFIGIYRYGGMSTLIKKVMAQNNLLLDSVCMQHLKNHNLHRLKSIIEEFQVPVNVIIHDYYSLCTNFRMVDSQEVPCGDTRPSEEKCAHCHVRQRGIPHFKAIYEFYQSILKYLHKVLVPSEYVRRSMEKAFPFLEPFIYTRPHLVLHGEDRRDLLQADGKIRIAYVGAQIRDKGYGEWKKLVDALSKTERYEFYYFGFGTDSMENVTAVYVAGASDQRTMDDYLKAYQIDCALSWSHCPETYSYVYYEMSVAGVYVLTNQDSGNITHQVKVNGNGHVFDSFEACMDQLTQPDQMIKWINEYRQNCTFVPGGYEANTELCISQDHAGRSLSVPGGEKYNVYRSTMVTFLYLMKHKFSNKGETKLTLHHFPCFDGNVKEVEKNHE